MDECTSNAADKNVHQFFFFKVDINKIKQECMDYHNEVVEKIDLKECGRNGTGTDTCNSEFQNEKLVKEGLNEMTSEYIKRKGAISIVQKQNQIQIEEVFIKPELPCQDLEEVLMKKDPLLLDTNEEVRREENNESDPLYKSDVCYKRCLLLSGLNQHRKKRTNKKYQCELCLKFFKYSQSLKEHIRTHTGEKPYACDFENCDMRFASPSNLNRHRKTHVDVRPYECQHCNKSFISNHDLFEHENVHSGEKVFKCGECNKGFTMSKTLREHARIHKGEKPYQCELCQKRFTQLTTLKTHKISHTGEKNYECSICLKRFTQANNLTTHKRIHAGMKPYSCQVCQAKFTHIKTYKNHIKSHQIGKNVKKKKDYAVMVT